MGVLLVGKRASWWKKSGCWTYAEAALRPRPREPPVTTATLPLREKSDGKSLRVVSLAMIEYVGR